MRLSSQTGRPLSPPRVIQQTNKRISLILRGRGKDARLPILKSITDYVVSSGGKRIRPLFTYYLGNAHGLSANELIDLGALIEIVHASSLLHDDVIDGADERRSRPTASKLHGNKVAVLAGDHLLSTGLKHLNTFGNQSYMDIFTHAIRALSAAELLQMEYQYNLKTTEDIHDRVIEGKTAVLFEAAGALVAVMRGERNPYASETAKLGHLFGRYFQLRDDYLDYFDSERLKKKGLQDFTGGIVTRPLMKLLQTADRTEKNLIHAQWPGRGRQTSAVDAKRILSLMRKHRIDVDCAAELEALEKQILRGLSALPGAAAREVISREFQKILAVRAA